jgi:hypothetical protein
VRERSAGEDLVGEELLRCGRAAVRSSANRCLRRGCDREVASL